MRIYWVLAWNQYYPSGALSDVESTWSTMEEAEARKKQLQDDPECYYDYIDVEDVSDLLGIDD